MNSLQSKHLYHRDYFTRRVDGHAEFALFRGEFDQLHERYQRNLGLLEVGSNNSFLDVGCGRGEIVVYHSQRGGVAVGIDYSAEAIALAQNKAAELGVNCDFRIGSFTEMPVEPGFDRILASEFIEHISPAEGKLFWDLAHRALKPGGRLLVYTYPNTLQRRIGYPLLRRLVRIFTGKKLALLQPDMQDEHYTLYHLNEQRYSQLVRSAKQAGFSHVHVFYDMPARQPRTFVGMLFQLIAYRGPWRHLFMTGLVCVARR